MKYEFCGPQWAAAMHACIMQRLAVGGPDCAESQMSVCEVFRNAPAHLADANGNVAWSVVVTDGSVDFRREERDDVAIKIVTDYASTLPNARFESISEAGHYPQIERPDQVAAAIERFARMEIL